MLTDEPAKKPSSGIPPIVPKALLGLVVLGAVGVGLSRLSERVESAPSMRVARAELGSAQVAGLQAPVFEGEGLVEGSTSFRGQTGESSTPWQLTLDWEGGQRVATQRMAGRAFDMAEERRVHEVITEDLEETEVQGHQAWTVTASAIGFHSHQAIWYCPESDRLMHLHARAPSADEVVQLAADAVAEVACHDQGEVERIEELALNELPDGLYGRVLYDEEGLAARVLRRRSDDEVRLYWEPLAPGETAPFDDLDSCLEHLVSLTEDLDRFAYLRHRSGRFHHVDPERCALERKVPAGGGGWTYWTVSLEQCELLVPGVLIATSRRGEGAAPDDIVAEDLVACGEDFQAQRAAAAAAPVEDVDEHEADAP